MLGDAKTTVAMPTSMRCHGRLLGKLTEAITVTVLELSPPPPLSAFSVKIFSRESLLVVCIEAWCARSEEHVQPQQKYAQAPISIRLAVKVNGDGFGSPLTYCLVCASSRALTTPRKSLPPDIHRWWQSLTGRQANRGAIPHVVFMIIMRTIMLRSL